MADSAEYIDIDNDADSVDTPATPDHFNDSDGESDHGVQRLEANITIPPADAGIDVFQKALQAAQLSMLELKVELRKAKKENVTLAENQPRRRLKGIPKEVSQHDKTIKDLGRQYAIMVSPWVDNACFGHKKRPDVDPLSPDRFKDKLSQHQANIAELFDFVPKDLHNLMEKHSHFADLFRAHVNAMRSTAAHSIREKAVLLFPVTGRWISGDTDRATIKELQDLITVDGEYKPFPRILFPNDSMKKADLFRNEDLAKILRVLFFGPSSLKSIHVPRPKTNAEIWKIKEVTAGSIAFAGILGRFLLSPDIEFSPKGNITGIDYLGDFNLYKRLLLSDSARMRSIYEWYNKRIFSKNNTKEVPSTAASDDQEENFEELLRAINEATLSDHDDEDGMISDPPTGTGVTPAATATGTLGAGVAPAATAATGTSGTGVTPAATATGTLGAGVAPAATAATGTSGTGVTPAATATGTLGAGVAPAATATAIITPAVQNVAQQAPNTRARRQVARSASRSK